MKTIALVLLTLAGCVFAVEPIVQVEAIAGKSPTEVAAVLGKPSKEEKTRQGTKLVYRSGQVEVVFISSKADWITVSEMQAVPFDENALAFLGFKAAQPTQANANTIRWEPLGNLKSVSIFPVNGKVDYAYIKVNTR